VGCLALLIVTSWSITGQAADPAEPMAKTDERHKPLPANYGMLGITDDQRAELYAMQESYEARLDKLREDLKQLVAERDKKLEGLLTTAQRARLKELRADAKKKADEKAAARQAAAAKTEAASGGDSKP
jgi:Skp family chaperone for outer membrane proteins